MSASDKKLNVILIDPWGTANTSEYLNGLIYGLSPIVNLTVFTNYYFELKVPSDAAIHRIFFKYSEKMCSGFLRKVLRGLEYVNSYNEIIRYLKKTKNADVVHINWLLNYKLDVGFLKEIKKYTHKLIYTAHNVVPHINGKEAIDELSRIYSLCDRIILHGKSIKDEFEQYFPDELPKIYIQRHGSNLKPNISFDENKVSREIKEKISKFKKKYIFFGRVFPNKGPDRLVAAWSGDWKDTLLIIAGHRDGDYPELEQYADKIANLDNILELNEYVDDDTLNYLISQSEIILLPYRHASMSGVVFTAADFKKTLICTNVGALPEYLENGVDSFVVENSDDAIIEALKYIQEDITEETLVAMGNRLERNIASKCAWDVVTKKLVDECYRR